MKNISAFFYPPDYANANLNRQRQIQLGVNICLVSIAILILIQPVFFLFLKTIREGLLAIPALALFLILLMLLRSGKMPFPVFANTLLGVSLLVHTINTCTTGGPMSIFLAGYIDMQIMAALLVERRSAYAWIFFQILVPFTLALSEQYGLHLPYTPLDARSPQMRLAMCTSITTGAAIFVILMKASLDSALGLLQRRNEELATAHQHQIRAEKLAAELEQQRSMEVLRQRIARDLHDDIGSALSAINIYSSIAAQQSGTSLPLLKKITDSSGALLDAMSDIVWSVNHSNDELEVLLNKMSEHAHAVLGAQEIAVSFKVDGSMPEQAIPAAVRKDLYLIYKEAVNNIVKHARASHVQICLSSVAGGILLQVTDDGVGFTPDHADNERNGLKNMAARASDIDAFLQISPGPDGGTSLCLMLPDRGTDRAAPDEGI